jgi:hypothetical protein
LKTNWEQYRAPENIAESENEQQKSADSTNWEQYRAPVKRNDEEFSVDLPLVGNVPIWKKIPKDIPYLKPGTEENKKWLGEEVNLFSGTPGMNIIKNTVPGILSRLMSKPIVQMGLRAGLGGSIGYGLNGKMGALEGAAIGVMAPAFLKKMGIGRGNPGIDIVNKVKPEEVEQRVESAGRLDTPLSPGEASGRPDLTSEEANIGRTGEGARERVKIGQKRIEKQKNAINDLFNKISKEDKISSFDVRKAAQDSIKQMENERQEAVDPYYKLAYKNKVNPGLIEKLEKSDPIIKESIDAVLNDKKYQVEGELLNEPRNSIKTLDYAKRRIDALIEQAKNSGDKDAVRVLNNTKNKLVKYTDRISPDYAEARRVYEGLSKPIDEIKNGHLGMISNLKDTQLKNLSKKIFDPSETDLNVLSKIKEKIMSENPEAWDSLVKNEMNRLMTHGKNRGITGRSFFDNVLSNDNRFNQFKAALSHNPEALSKLTDMKKAWEHLINIETPRTAFGQSKTSMNKPRELMQAFIDSYNEMMGSDKQVKALKYLYSDKWNKDLKLISSFKNNNTRKNMMSGLISKVIVPAYYMHKGDSE